MQRSRNHEMLAEVCHERALNLLADAAARRKYAVRFPAFDRQDAA